MDKYEILFNGLVFWAEHRKEFDIGIDKECCPTGSAHFRSKTEKPSIVICICSYLDYKEKLWVLAHEIGHFYSCKKGKLYHNLDFFNEKEANTNARQILNRLFKVTKRSYNIQLNKILTKEKRSYLK